MPHDSNSTTTLSQADGQDPRLRSDQTLRGALEWAANGWPVFPVAVTWNETAHKYVKQPLCKGGYLAASKDPSQIKQWWAQFPNASIGGVPGRAGYVVLDPDNGHDPRDLAGLPATYTVATISGGRHLYFATNEKFGNCRWAPKVDTRCASGFVVLPPSPGYKVIDDRDIADFPDWAVERLRKATAPVEAAEPQEQVDPIRLRHTLARIDPNRYSSYDEWARMLAAIAGSGGDADLALRWSSGELGNWPCPDNYCGDNFDMQEKLASFARADGPKAGFGSIMRAAYPQEPAAAAGPTTKEIGLQPLPAGTVRRLVGLPPLAPGVDPFSDNALDELNAALTKRGPRQFLGDLAGELTMTLEELIEAVGGPTRLVLFRSRNEAMNQRPPEMLVEALIPKNKLIIPYGGTGEGKTYFVAEIATAVAMRRPAFGKFQVIAPPQPGIVVVFAGEDCREFDQSRLVALEQHYGRSLEGLLYTTDLAIPLTDPALLQRYKDELHLLQDLTGKPIELIVNDTLGRSIGQLNPNEQTTGQRFTMAMEQLIQEFDTTILCNAHDNKSGSGTVSGTQVFLDNAPVTPHIVGQKSGGQLTGFTVTMEPKYRIGKPPAPFSVTAQDVTLPNPVNGAHTDMIFIVAPQRGSDKPAIWHEAVRVLIEAKAFEYGNGLTDDDMAAATNTKSRRWYDARNSKTNTGHHLSELWDKRGRNDVRWFYKPPAD